MISGIILAAGSATRFKENKLLLDWFGTPLIRHICLQAIASDVDKVIVVLKSGDDETEAAINDLPIEIVFNPFSYLGQSTSIKTGLVPLLSSEAVVIMLADQPFLSAGLINLLITIWEEGNSPIVAPYVGGKRANPVLFDRILFNDLLNISGDSGGRQLFDIHKVKKADWPDPKILLDIDTQENWIQMKENKEQ